MRSWLKRAWAEGSVASLLSAAVLAACGRAETGRWTAAINAPSHWLWGRRALRTDAADLRHTLLGAMIHHASSVFWAVFYEMLQSRRQRLTASSAMADAAMVSAAAALVDLRLVPERLTPGFERRLSPGSLAWVYAGFAAGLAVGGLMLLRSGTRRDAASRGRAV